jgi:branched-chain amino acid aminotransferase
LELVRERLSKGPVGQLAPLEAVERTLTIGDIEKASKEGRIVESFVSGTAVSLSLLFYFEFFGFTDRIS